MSRERDNQREEDQGGGGVFHDLLLIAGGIVAGLVLSDIVVNWLRRDDTDPGDPELEERVLEAFDNDPTLSERAIEIASTPGGNITLLGWVYTEGEVEYAATIARGVPGVTQVTNRLTVRADEQGEAEGESVGARDDEGPAAE